MRTWILVLAVLTTFKPITQVVSTQGNNINYHSKYINNNDNKNEDSNTNNETKGSNTKNNATLSPVISHNINKRLNSNISNNNLNNINIINNYMNYNSNKSVDKLNLIRINNKNSTLISNNLYKNKSNINNTNNQIKSKDKDNNRNIQIINEDNFNNLKQNIKVVKTNKIDEVRKESSIRNNNESHDDTENEDNSSNYNDNLRTSENGKLKPDPETLVQIETSLLSLFGLRKPPKVDRSKIVIPEAMKRLYAQIMGNEFDSVTIPKPGLHTHSANTVRSFTHENTDSDNKFQHHHRFRLYFNLNSIPTDENLKAAELQISRDKIEFEISNTQQQRQRFRILVYDILKNGNDLRDPTRTLTSTTTSYLLLDTKIIYLNSSETLSFDVHSAVNRWLESPDSNNGLLIEVKTARTLKPARHNHVRLRRSLEESNDEWLRKQPLLFTYTDDGRHKTRLVRDTSQRSKRAHHSRNGHHRRKNSICQRRPLYVDFNDVGWSDWIVAPPGYDAYYCQGECAFPLADHLNSTNHAVVQTLVNNITPAKVPKACCIPTQLSAISMLYLNDQNQVVLKNYQDMTVVGCGCR